MKKEVVEKIRRIKGEEHPDTIKAVTDLTKTLRATPIRQGGEDVERSIVEDEADPWRRTYRLAHKTTS
jgi:hypothetical protein